MSGRVALILAIVAVVLMLVGVAFMLFDQYMVGGVSFLTASFVIYYRESRI